MVPIEAGHHATPPLAAAGPEVFLGIGVWLN